MGPRSSLSDVVNSTFRHLVGFCEGRGVYICEGPYLLNLLGGEFSGMSVFDFLPGRATSSERNSYVPPHRSLFYKVDGVLAHAVNFSDLDLHKPLISNKVADFSHFLRCKFSIAMPVSEALAVPGDFVGDVVSVSPREKVVRVDTLPIVAFVADNCTLGLFSKLPLIGVYVREGLKFFVGKSTIPVRANGSEPLEAPLCSRSGRNFMGKTAIFTAKLRRRSAVGEELSSAVDAFFSFHRTIINRIYAFVNMKVVYGVNPC